MLDEQIKLQLYKCFIMCFFDYYPVVWYNCNKTNIVKVENIQYRALKSIYNSDYCTLLKKSGLLTLEEHRKH